VRVPSIREMSRLSLARLSEDETHPKKMLYFLQNGHNATHFYNNHHHHHYYYCITLARFLSASIAI